MKPGHGVVEHAGGAAPQAGVPHFSLVTCWPLGAGSAVSKGEEGGARTMPIRQGTKHSLCLLLTTPFVVHDGNCR